MVQLVASVGLMLVGQLVECIDSMGLMQLLPGLADLVASIGASVKHQRLQRRSKQERKIRRISR